MYENEYDVTQNDNFVWPPPPGYEYGRIGGRAQPALNGALPPVPVPGQPNWIPSPAMNSYPPSFSDPEEWYGTPMAKAQAGPSTGHLPPQQAPGPIYNTYPPPPPPPPGAGRARQLSIQSNPPYPPQPPSAGTSTMRSSYTPQEHTSSATPEQDGRGAASQHRRKSSGLAESRSEDEPKNGGNKKKRKKSVADAEGDAAPQAAEAPKEKEKRTKTGRACDACRTKKIRCDILTQIEKSRTGDGQPICAHCKQAGIECTSFLPITETRFKKKKQTNESQPDGSTSAPGAEAGSPAAGVLESPSEPREVPARVEGPTSLSFLLQTSLPASTSEAWDLREHNKWEISEDGDGIIKVTAPPNAGSHYHADADLDDPSKAHNRLNKPVLSAHTISLLVNAYFDYTAPLFPIVCRTDFTTNGVTSPLLLYSICGLGATRRQFPRELFSGVRGVINGLLRSNDILSDARFENVQALLLLSQVGDLHAQPTAATASASLMRLASAIRMAQDLGLHRESTVRAQTAEDLVVVENRRRVWATCVILDRWFGAALGIPLLVDLLDCDVLLPAPYRIVLGTEPSTWPIEPSFVGLAEHLKLSILVGRVLKTIYSPTGLKHAKDEQLESILADMREWHANLPDHLRFTGNDSGCAAGLLHLSYTALQFLFWRVFMRITYTCPPHVTFRLHIKDWNDMLKCSTESMEWLHAKDDALDTIFIYAYTATSCALVQYHTWARRRTRHALDMLKLVKETANKWEAAVKPDQMSIRRKTCETMTLLYEAALKTNPVVEEPQDRPAAVNPTTGVRTRDAVGKVFWLKDEDMPGGGIWVASCEEDIEDCGVPRDCVMLESELEPNSKAAKQFELAKAKDEHATGDEGHNLSSTEERLTGPQPTQPTILSLEEGEEDSARGEGSMDLPGHQGQAHPLTEQQQQQLSALGIFQDFQSTSNVNPQLNFGDFGDSQIMATPQMVQNGDATIDFTLLEGLPMSGFDFPSWEQYFQGINQNIPTDAYGLMQ